MPNASAICAQVWLASLASSTMSANTFFASTSMVANARMATKGSVVILSRYEASAAGWLKCSE